MTSHLEGRETGESMPWKMGRVMFLGASGVGKSALCNSMIGKPFLETKSTAGLALLTCEAARSSGTRAGRWAVRSEGSATETETETNLIPDKAIYSERDQILSENVTHKLASSADISTQRLPIDGRFSSGSVRDLILCLFDFGGQSVYNVIHHLLLTASGIYLVVFRMTDLLDENKKEDALKDLLFWMHTITIHRPQTDSYEAPPLFLVGTHKDVVADTTLHSDISNLITEKLCNDRAWQLSKHNGLCFFPVNNLSTQHKDETVVDLMIAIECAASTASYVSAAKPLSWLQAWDKLAATKQFSLPIEAASLIATQNGVRQDMVSSFLSFLNEIGLVLWLNETGVRDVVVLDVMRCIVKPFTILMSSHACELRACPDVFQLPQENNAAWDNFIKRGIIDNHMLQILFSDDFQPSDISVIINAFVNFGLFVKVETTHVDFHTLTQSNSCVQQYLVPALPPKPDSSVEY